MSWTDRLRRFAVGDPHQALVEHLRVLHQRSADRAARFSASAAEAPTPGAEEDLRALAADEGHLTAVLAQALAERGAAPAAAAAATRNGATPNHWARLVAALDACREGHDQVARATANLIALDPSVAGLLDTLARQLDAEIAALRDLVARADPHAFD
jgi:hypothetical protein